MRLPLLAAVVIAGLTAPAVACPPIEACLVNLRSTASVESDVSEKTIDVPLVAPDKRAAKSEPPEVPWIWRVLRERVYSQMPTYRDRNALKVMLAPVVVTSPSDTVPGLGIAGDF